jgi:site-specific DNA recombinase
LGKQALVNRVFDSQLYYKDGTYRTPYIMPLFRLNALILKEKNLLIIDKSGGFGEDFPSGGAGGTVIEHLTGFLTLLKEIA